MLNISRLVVANHSPCDVWIGIVLTDAADPLRTRRDLEQDRRDHRMGRAAVHPFLKMTHRATNMLQDEVPG